MDVSQVPSACRVKGAAPGCQPLNSPQTCTCLAAGAFRVNTALTVFGAAAVGAGAIAASTGLGVTTGAADFATGEAWTTSDFSDVALAAGDLTDFLGANLGTYIQCYPKKTYKHGGFCDVRLLFLPVLIFAWIFLRWFNRKTPAPTEGKEPYISAPNYGSIVCSPQEHPRLLLRESAKHFRMAFELLGLIWMSFLCDLKHCARNSIPFPAVFHLKVFPRTKGNNSCPQSDAKNQGLSNAKNIDAPGELPDSVNPCQKPPIPITKKSSNGEMMLALLAGLLSSIGTGGLALPSVLASQHFSQGVVV